MGADHVRIIRMVFREELVIELLFDQTVGFVLNSLATLIAHDIALVGKLLAVQRFQQVAHTVALQPQCQFQLIGG